MHTSATPNATPNQTNPNQTVDLLLLSDSLFSFSEQCNAMPATRHPNQTPQNRILVQTAPAHAARANTATSVAWNPEYRQLVCTLRTRSGCSSGMQRSVAPISCSIAASSSTLPAQGPRAHLPDWMAAWGFGSVGDLVVRGIPMMSFCAHLYTLLQSQNVRNPHAPPHTHTPKPPHPLFPLPPPTHTQKTNPTNPKPKPKSEPQPKPTLSS